MKSDLPVLIVGGGPAGMVAGLLFARAGVHVTVLEKHADFLRDFRGDTVHPSTLELFNEIGLLGDLLKEPHAAIDTMTLNLMGERFTIATMTHLPVAARFVAMMPQWDLLDFIAGQGKRYPTFDLRMSTEATGLTHDDAGRVSGVMLANGETLSARLVIAADGRRSVLRDAGELPLEDLGAPMDVLWFRVPVPAGTDMSDVALGTIDKGGMVVAIPRGDYWQCAQIIEKGGFAPIEARGIGAFRERIVAIVPGLAAGIDAIASLDDTHLQSRPREIKGADETVVAGADDQRVIGFGHEKSFARGDWTCWRPKPRPRIRPGMRRSKGMVSSRRTARGTRVISPRNTGSMTRWCAKRWIACMRVVGVQRRS